MDFKKSKRLLAYLVVIYWIFAIGIYSIAYPQFRYSPVLGEKLVADSVVGEIYDDQVYTQQIISPCDVIETVAIMTGSYDRENTGYFVLSLRNGENILLVEKIIPVSDFINNEYTTISLDSPIEVGAGEEVVFEIKSRECEPGNAITVYVSGSMNSQKTTENHRLNGEEARGTLCIQLNGYNNLGFYLTYLFLVSGAFVLMSIYAAWCWKQAKKDIPNPLATLCILYSRYGFLMKQLVAREFKQKYKRSTLGMAWSVMNPLLTMIVQYVVFSTIFKSDIPNYPVYLLSGIVFFSFFNEAVNLGMTAIISNASLIKKVYMPKYIYPISRVITSLVNFALALIPLFLIVIGTRVPVKASMLLLIFDIFCFLMFIVGVSLLLSTIVTFFQDMLHLWGVLCMMWQYLTPIFYPETIIPAKFLDIYRLNPLYQFITFARTCIIDGISPAPESYFMCLFYAAGMLIVGAVVFKRYQNEFAFHL